MHPYLSLDIARAADPAVVARIVSPIPVRTTQGPRLVAEHARVFDRDLLALVCGSDPAVHRLTANPHFTDPALLDALCRHWAVRLERRALDCLERRITPIEFADAMREVGEGVMALARLDRLLPLADPTGAPGLERLRGIVAGMRDPAGLPTHEFLTGCRSESQRTHDVLAQATTSYPRWPVELRRLDEGGCRIAVHPAADAATWARLLSGRRPAPALLRVLAEHPRARQDPHVWAVLWRTAQRAEHATLLEPGCHERTGEDFARCFRRLLAHPDLVPAVRVVFRTPAPAFATLRADELAPLFSLPDFTITSQQLGSAQDFALKLLEAVAHAAPAVERVPTAESTPALVPAHPSRRRGPGRGSPRR